MSEEEVIEAAIGAEIALVPGDTPVAVLSPSYETFDFSAEVEKAKQLSEQWVIEIPVVGRLLDSLAKHTDTTFFVVTEMPGKVFATNAELQAGRSQVLIKDGVIGIAAASAPTPASAADEPTVQKVFKTEEERFVLGVVLAPETTDSQGDIYSADEVRKAAHDYMENAGALGKQHREIVTGKLKILESYLAPADFTVEDETIAKGTWLMGIRVIDEDLWEGIKKGDFTGFSIGGQAYRTPTTPAS